MRIFNNSSSSKTPAKKSVAHFATALGFLVFLSGCSFINGSEESSPTSNSKVENSVAWLNNGALSFGGPVPVAAAAEAAAVGYQDYAYGFSPGASTGAKSLIISTSKKMAKLMQAGKEVANAKLLDTSGLVAGSYQVAHKQRNPLWYAPSNYFSSRDLPVPAEGDKLRYLRGAFGDFAIFVSPTEAIHSGPFSLSELTGARIEEQDFAKIFYMVEIGDSIKVE